MNKAHHSVIAASLAAVACVSHAESNNHVTEITTRHKGEIGFPTVVGADIKGAPEL